MNNEASKHWNRLLGEDGESQSLKVLKNRLDKCPSDTTGTGGLALRWRDGEDGPLGPIPVLQPGEIGNIT